MQNIRIAIKRYKFKPYMIFPRNNIKKNNKRAQQWSRNSGLVTADDNMRVIENGKKGKQNQEN
jgi:hypothetical protein